jgi:hypothetical protein
MLFLTAPGARGAGLIQNDTLCHVLRMQHAGLSLTVDYLAKCVIRSLRLGDHEILDTSRGMFSGVLVDSSWWTTALLPQNPRVEISGDTARIKGVTYGPSGHEIQEEWTFSCDTTDIVWRIDRLLPTSMIVSDDACPSVNLMNIRRFDGALLGDGGVAWFRLFNDSLDAYGVHTDEATFWNSPRSECFRLVAHSAGRCGSVKFFRAGDLAGCSFAVSPAPSTCRYDAGTHRRRYVRGRTDVWEDQRYPAGLYQQEISISAPSYERALGRGTFHGIDGTAVASILNTVARLGVIDADHFGGNSWATPYGPICLHEQYIAQFGIGIDDEHYISGYKECLDYYRDHAIEPDGRVKARWAYTNEDASPGSADSLGFYEAQWGLLLDSNPDYVINVADLFDQCGDRPWLQGQKGSCERALDYMVQRDSDHDSLVEMATRSHREQRGSDWIDVIWASWENAFVNAELYHALTSWAALESFMGDTIRAGGYRRFAEGLRRHFNKPIAQGGFWDPAHGWYVHWREPDGTVWGDNLVVPVNVMAIGYGLCTESARRLSILHAMDEQMQKEDLFFWPLCMFSYEPEAGHAENFPFPNYENGDIFLSWGELAIRAFVQDFPEVAVRYVQRLVDQYGRDGLAYQRYLRLTQKGAGDDILAGNASAVVGLYRDIYGIQPRYNRLYLDPHLVKELYGTVLRYRFQGEEYRISLNGYQNDITSRGLSVRSPGDFGVKRCDRGVLWFRKSSANPSLVVNASDHDSVQVTIIDWSTHRRWVEVASEAGTVVAHEILDLTPGDLYGVYRDGRLLQAVRAHDGQGLQFSSRINADNATYFEIRQISPLQGVDPNDVMTTPRPAIDPPDTLAFSRDTVFLQIRGRIEGSVVRYTLDGSVPTIHSPQFRGPLRLSSSVLVRARAWREGMAVSPVASSDIHFVRRDTVGVFAVGGKNILCHKAYGSSVRLTYAFAQQYAASGPGALTDGILGTGNYETAWQGFEENDLDATIDMREEKSVESVRIGFLDDSTLWIYPPLSVRIEISRDGKTYEPLDVTRGRPEVFGNGSLRREYIGRKNDVRCRFIRVHARNRRVCPAGHPGAGGKAWLFADEVVVE